MTYCWTKTKTASKFAAANGLRQRRKHGHGQETAKKGLLYKDQQALKHHVTWYCMQLGHHCVNYIIAWGPGHKSATCLEQC